MQTMPLILRQTIRSSIRFSRATPTPRPAQLPLRPSPVPVRPNRSFSVCLRCQFRQQPRLHDPASDKDKFRYPLGGDSKAAESPLPASVPPELTPAEQSEKPESENERFERELVQNLEADLERRKESAQNATAEAIADMENEVNDLKTKAKQRDEDSRTSAVPEGTKRGGLPSFVEERRSKMSKQFTTMMDNLQSNVFVAGQRLNDLTGYSGIEALKNEVQEQESALRAARAQVKASKEAYQAAITNRSTSQREVNELLQRKHSWSPSDLERFTLLYRNDHANQVAETEAEEALTRAERESEERAAQLSKSILSRYHEEQVWSDKIRRMSTWGTWGLMGVNVLLFLIFQVAVEPWRRSRLVKGFEDKVVEALEKEKALSQAVVPVAVSSKGLETSVKQEPAAPLDAPSTSESATSETGPSVIVETTPLATEAAPAAPVTATQTLYSRIASLSTSPLTVEYWQQVFNELLSDRSVALSQRDLTVTTVQSAAAGAVGAAAVALLISLVRPQ